MVCSLSRRTWWAVPKTTAQGADGRTCPTHRATTTGRGAAAREITHSPSSSPRLADGSTASLSKKSEGPWVPDHENSILTFDCQHGHLLSQHLSQVLSSVKDVLPVVPHCLDDIQWIGHESSGSAVPSCEGLTIDETGGPSSSFKGRNMAFVRIRVESCNELYASFKRRLLHTHLPARQRRDPRINRSHHFMPTFCLQLCESFLESSCQ